MSHVDQKSVIWLRDIQAVLKGWGAMRDDDSGSTLAPYTRSRNRLPPLPVPVARPIGRDEELARLPRWFVDGARTVALTGVPGSGKTRLSLHVAQEVQRQTRWSALFLPLAALSSSGLIPDSIAQALSIGDDGSAAIHRVHRRLNDLGPILMVLDNLEHLAGAEEVIAALVEGSPELRVLATSRHVLSIPGSLRFDVQPLPVLRGDASPAALRDNAAVQLFATLSGRAHFTVTDEDLPEVGQICASLDGLPLAIELAAAKAPELGINALVKHLDERGELLTLTAGSTNPRHRSLRAAISWSYDLLSEESRTALNRLALFTGGFSRESAHRMLGTTAVLEQHVPPPDESGLYLQDYEALTRSVRLRPLVIPGDQAIAELLHANLIQAGVGADGDIRYQMLESIREFGLERLEESGEEGDARLAYAVTMLQFVDIAAFELWTQPSQARHWPRLGEELGNLRAVMSWACDPANNQPTLAAKLMISAWFYFQLSGLITEGRSWLERALALPGATPWSRLHVMNSLAFYAWVQGDFARAEELAQTVMNTWKPPFPAQLNGIAYFNMGLVKWQQGDFPSMHQHMMISKEILHEAQDLNGEGFCDLALGVLARFGKDFATAQALLDEALELHTRADHAWGAATSRYLAGETAHDAGDLPRAAALIADGLGRYREQGDVYGCGACVAALAVFAAERNELERAARLFAAAFALCEHAGVLLPPVDLERYQQTAAMVAAQVPVTAFQTGRRWSLDQAADEALALATEIEAGRIPGPANDPLREMLTPEQLDAVNLLCEGLSVHEMADRLFRDPNTIYDRLARARQRLGVTSNRQLVAKVVSLRSNGGGSSVA